MAHKCLVSILLNLQAVYARQGDLVETLHSDDGDFESIRRLTFNVQHSFPTLRLSRLSIGDGLEV
jgi:hypothetical protein